MMRSRQHSSTRREFLTTTSLAVAGTMIGARHLMAGIPVKLPPHSLAPVRTFLPEHISPPDLRSLATRAVDTAKSVGASYADVRVAIRHHLEPDIGRVILTTHATYGVRAQVDGVWGFAYGRTLTPDALARSAEDAVTSAQVSARMSRSAVGVRTERSFSKSADAIWTPPPVVTGEWRSPVVVDPFTVSVQQHGELARAMWVVAGRIPRGSGMFSAKWEQETRVFATTTGSLVTQHVTRALPDIQPGFAHSYRSVRGRVPTMHWASAGFEIMNGSDWADQIIMTIEDMQRLARLPLRSMDVGRYPIVLDGYSMANVLGNLVGPALEADRMLGLDANVSSRVTPDLFGTSIASPLLTVSGHRAVPSVTAVQWDDDGVVPTAHTIIRDGVLVDCHTDTITARAMQPWYARRNTPAESHGCAVAPQAETAVTVRAPHLTMAHNPNRCSVEELCKDMQTGIVALATKVRTDQQISSGSLWDGLFEVARGQIVRQIIDNTIQFTSKSFLKGLLAVGDVTTVRQDDMATEKGMPWITYYHSATAPAARFKEVDVLSNPDGF